MLAHGPEATALAAVGAAAQALPPAALARLIPGAVDVGVADGIGAFALAGAAWP